MQGKAKTIFLIISVAVGLTGCAAYFPSPSGPAPVKPLYRCIAMDANKHKYLWVSGSQSVSVNRALFSCDNAGGVNCEITECKTKLIMKAY